MIAFQISKVKDMLLDQGLTTPDLIISTCSQNESLHCDEGHQPADIIKTMKEADCLRVDGGHKISSCERLKKQTLSIIPEDAWT